MTIMSPDEPTRGTSSSGYQTGRKYSEEPNQVASPNYSIVKRLNFALRLVLLSLLITGILSTATLIYINSIESNLTTRVEPLIGLNDQINTEVLSAILDARNYIITQNKILLNQFNQSLGDYKSTYKKALK
jgi:CHASE3 domain sensor protein